MKRIVALLLFLLISSASLISCKETENNNNGSKDIINENSVSNDKNFVGEENKTDTTPQASDSGTGIVENGNKEENAINANNPTVKDEPHGDTYYYVEETVNGTNFEIVGELLSSEYVIYTVDSEKYGICDINAKVIVEPEFTLIGWCPWHEVVYADPFPEGREPIVISDKFKIDLHYGHGGFGKSFYIFDNNTGKMFSGGTDIELIYLEEVTNVSVDTPYINYTGTSPLSEGDYYVGGENEDVYNLLESLIFGTAEYEFITSKGSIVSLGNCEIADVFVNDYMLVKRNGKIGFVDLLGNDACEFKYTDAMRAFDSKAWVKSEDGKWKVVNLK